MQQMHQEKIRKDIDGVRKQLNHERSLKLDAFTRVDDLQTQVSLDNLKINLDLN